MARGLTAKPKTTNARADYYDRIDPHNLAPLWEVLHELLKSEPVTEATPYLWHYDGLRSLLLESAEMITAAEAERRVLMLENPSMRESGPCITEALFAGLQLIMPGEVAPAHRHSPAALRFIIEGSGGYTAINGEKAYMEPGDLILTPSWVWHDHGHEGDAPVVWLDGLDIPLLRHLGPIFAEPYGDGETYPAGRPTGDNIARYGGSMLPMGESFATQNSPVFHYPYTATREAIQAMNRAGELDPCHGIKMEYVNPSTGGPVMPTLSSFMQYLPKRFAAKTFQSTAAWVYSVVEGEGRTVIGEETLKWGPRDIFVVPAWYPHHHEASAESYLFSFSDMGIHKKLGLYREKRANGKG